MNVSLTPDLERFVAERVASGEYQSASEVVQEALQLLQECQRKDEANLAALRADIAEGIADLDSGNVFTGEEVFAYLRAKRAAREGR